MPILNEPIATEIIPGLWLGNLLASQDRNFMNKFNVKYIVNVTHNFPNFFKDKVYLKIPVRNRDKRTYSLLKKNLPPSFRFIKRGLTQGEVLVHCKSGHRRSATVVANFLMNQFGISKRQAIKYIKKLRPSTFPPRTYIKNIL